MNESTLATSDTIAIELAKLAVLVRGNQPAIESLARLADAVELMRQRSADREAQRLGDVARRGMTPEAYYAAVRESQKNAPTLWVAVYTKPGSDGVTR